MFTEPLEHVVPLGRPYVRRHSGVAPAALLLHGFASSPYTMRDLADFLFAHGYNVFVPRLPGHASRLRYLRASTGKDWQEAVHAAAVEAGEKSRSLAILGRSFGGVLAMLELARHPDVACAFVTLGTPHRARHQTMLEMLLPVLGLVMPNIKKPWAKSSERIVRMEMGRYMSMPVPALRAYFATNRQLTPAVLASITTPALFLQGRLDAQAPKESMDFFLRHLGSVDKDAVWIEGVTHVADQMHASPQLQKRILRFLDQHC